MSLPHTDPLSAHTPPTPAPQVAIDDEEERVARAGYENLYCKPTAIGWEELTDYSKSQWRRIARAAIRAIREGGQRWGVYMKNRNKWWGLPESWSSSDRDAVEVVYQLLASTYREPGYEVRPYPGEREKTAEELIDEAVATFNLPEPIRTAAKSKLHLAVQAAAIRDAKGGK